MKDRDDDACYKYQANLELDNILHKITQRRRKRCIFEVFRAFLEIITQVKEVL